MAFAQQAASPRREVTLDTGWRTVENDSNPDAHPGFERPGYHDDSWRRVTVPHNWDDYGGYRRMKNGNRYGYAWYRKDFRVPANDTGSRYFLWFEGVGSYATVWLNGHLAGRHAGGRTSFTLDVTPYLSAGGGNILCVRADEPRMIRDLPWVSGGDSPEPGFSEGSQPLGIFRPVHLIVTANLRVEPFGVHIWNDTTVSGKHATLYLITRLKNYGTDRKPEKVTIQNMLVDAKGRVRAKVQTDTLMSGSSVLSVSQSFLRVPHPHLWSLQDPYLYHVMTRVRVGGRLVDQTETPYGIRWISWPHGRKGNGKQFLLNGKPVFINGVAGYEHLLGQSHAFSALQVAARVSQVEAAGFNAFRDAHQPHNLRYGRHFEQDGILWWPQFAAHIWFDSPAFKKNFKKLLEDWIIERRDNPAVILWGLENESTLPEDFAEECSREIRRLDPTASSQRLITTCNGGTGTDWNVPQNWSGTYGGDPTHYAAEVQTENLVGEYGAWRSIDLHSEGPFEANGPLSENRMAQLLEMKVRQADSVKDRFSGQFMWLLSSHDNPGRVQSGEGYRALDQVGPVNYKGLFTIWGEPVDAFYMYRSNFVSADKHPMVYIVSHRWADRWTRPGIKNGITVYSNCDEVELFNDVNHLSLGRKKSKGRGTHFEWDHVPIRYNVLYAVGYVGGKAVARDCIVLHHLTRAPSIGKLRDTADVTRPRSGMHYLYRVNCGGPDYHDENGSLWMADRPWTDSASWGSVSWANQYPGIQPYFASQRRTFDPITGTPDWKLFQTLRYGRQYLKYRFPVPDGRYRVELYFVEPWYGIGGGIDCDGWRSFDIAVNGVTRVHHLDIWRLAGVDHALKKTLNVRVTGGELTISFPAVQAGEAVISAIAIATLKEDVKPAPGAPLLMIHAQVHGHAPGDSPRVASWLDTGQPRYGGGNTRFSHLPPALYGASWLKFPTAMAYSTEEVSFQVSAAADVFVGMAAQGDTADRPGGFARTGTWLGDDQGHRLVLYHRRYPKGARVRARGVSFIGAVYASAMPPPYDQRTPRSYRIEEAAVSGQGVSRSRVNSRPAITFSEDEGARIIWKVKIPIAGSYCLQIRYANPENATREAKLAIVSDDGVVLDRKRLKFSPTRTGKWSTLEITTDSQINAGHYTVRISAVSAKGVSVSGLRIQ